MKVDTYTFTTGLLIIFGIFVIYTRMRDWVESNVPIFFYFIMAVYVNTYTNGIPTLPVYIGLVLTLLLRFEFMNKGVSLLLRVSESCTLVVLLYWCWQSMHA